MLSMLLVFFSSCSLNTVPPHIAAADRVSKPYMKQMCTTKNLSILGSGGRMMKQVHDISISFVAYGEYDITETRAYFLGIVKPFVHEIESSHELQQYLAQPDHPERAAQISITFRDGTHQQPSPPNIAHVLMVDGRICYSVNDSPMSAYRPIHRETYQEALEKLNYETNNI
jgi:hypothetical protein